MNLALISLNTPNIEQYASISVKTIEKYAELWNIDTHIYKHTLDSTREPPWSKIIALKNHLKDYDWLMWIDADAIIVKYDNFHDIVNNNDKLFLFTKDENGINSGVFFIRNSEESYLYLEKIYDSTEFINHIWWEQAAIHHLVNTDEAFRNSIGYIDKDIYNSYEITENSSILHLPARTTEYRSKVFKKIYKED